MTTCKFNCTGVADEAEAIPAGATVTLRLLDATNVAFTDFIADGQVVSEIEFTADGAPGTATLPTLLAVRL